MWYTYTSVLDLKAFLGYSLPDQLNSKSSGYNIAQLSKQGYIITASYSCCQFVLAQLWFCNVVNTLDWVVGLTSSLENAFMMMYVEMRSADLKVICIFAKPIEIYSPEILLKINSQPTDKAKILLFKISCDILK